jgi:hypothetical protein
MTRAKTQRLAAIPDQPISTTTPDEPSLDRNTQARIGDHLRAMYDELLQQPVPDRFRDLLGRLDGTTENKADEKKS